MYCLQVQVALQSADWKSLTKPMSASVTTLGNGHSRPSSSPHASPGQSLHRLRSAPSASDLTLAEALRDAVGGSAPSQITWQHTPGSKLLRSSSLQHLQPNDLTISGADVDAGVARRFDSATMTDCNLYKWQQHHQQQHLGIVPEGRLPISISKQGVRNHTAGPSFAGSIPVLANAAESSGPCLSSSAPAGNGVSSGTDDFAGAAGTSNESENWYGHWRVWQRHRSSSSGDAATARNGGRLLTRTRSSFTKGGAAGWRPVSPRHPTAGARSRGKRRRPPKSPALSSPFGKATTLAGITELHPCTAQP
jgi:hypothetical protein